jgi:hypothetical protein
MKFSRIPIAGKPYRPYLNAAKQTCQVAETRPVLKTWQVLNVFKKSRIFAANKKILPI